MRSPVAAQQLWWPRLLAVLLLAMVRVLVRRNGTRDPAFALRIDTVGDAATAKQAFVDEAAGLLRVERTVPYEKVGIFLPGGVTVDFTYLEKDDEIYVAFDGGEWQPPG